MSKKRGALFDEENKGIDPMEHIRGAVRLMDYASEEAKLDAFMRLFHGDDAADAVKQARRTTKRSEP